MPFIRRVLGGALAALALVVSSAALAVERAPWSAAHRPGELIVRFREGATRAARDRAHAKHGGQRVKELRGIRAERVRVRMGQTVRDAVDAYRAEPSVEYAEPDYLYWATATPNDPVFAREWGLHNTGQAGGTADADIDAPEAWDLVTGAPPAAPVVVGVIDTGIDPTHEDIAANLWTNPGEIPGNGLDDDANGVVDDVHGLNAITGTGDPLDDHGHGTHVAGTIGAVGNNGAGIAGVAWGVQLAVCKFLGAGGSGYVSDAAECLDYFRDLKLRGINVVLTSNSWGGGGDSQALREAIARDQAAGILFVVAAGNEGTNIDAGGFFPPAIRSANMIIVAATDQNDARASFSNYGRFGVDVGAPGVDVVSLRASGTDMYQDALHFVPEDLGSAARYYRASGTSMATPHVSGVAALLAAADPARPWWTNRNLILAGGDSVPSMAGVTTSGRRLNARGALACASGPVFAPVRYPATYPDYTPGSAAVLEAYSFDCATATGPVTATTAGGEVVQLRDDGVAPDQVAGDGRFSGSWTPTGDTDVLTFQSPLGSYQTERIPAFAIATDRLPAAKLLTTYAGRLQAVGAVPPVIWAFVEGGGSVPPGLTVEPSGRVAGIPTALGPPYFLVSASDAMGRRIHARVELTVSDAPLVEAWRHEEEGNVTGVAVDGSGNVFAGVWHDSWYTDGNHAYLPSLEKHDSTGRLLWRREIGVRGSWGDRTLVAVDAAGAAYVGVSPNSMSWLVRKYDAAGTAVWERTFVAPGWGGTLAGLAVGKDGLLRVTGYASAASPSYAVTWHTIAYDTAGALAWQRDDAADSIPAGVAVDPAGNTYVAGAPRGYASGYRVIKLDAAGRLLWDRATTTSGGEQPVAVSAGADGIGIVTDAQRWDPATGTWTSWRAVRRLDPLGNLVWSQVEDTLATGRTYKGAVLDADGGLITVGEGLSRHELRYFTANGQLSWSLELDANSSWYDGGRSVALGPDGRRVVVGGAGPFSLGFTFDFDLRYPHVMETPHYGLAGALYHWQPRVQYGTAPYSWSMSPAPLMPGLAFDPATGMLGGFTTTVGSFPFRLTATDAAGIMTSRDLVLDVHDITRVVTASLPGGRVGDPYVASLEAAGGIPPYRWAVTSGGLPPGVVLDPAGTIAGTPAAGGAYEVTLTVTDSGNVASASGTFTVAIEQPLTVTTGSLPPGLTGAGYTSPLSAVGGMPPYHWAVTVGALPAGLALSPAGVISGVPAATGTSTFTATVGDAAGASATASLSLAVYAPVELTTASLSFGVVGEPYAAALGAAGGQPPYTWSVADGALAPGLALETAAGVLSGVPESAGVYPVALQVSDSSGLGTASRAFTVTIREPVAVVTASLPAASTGSAYSAALAATGGVAPYRWSVTSGALTPGLSLSMDGTLAGTPVASGSFAFTVAVSDGGGTGTASRDFTLVVQDPVAIVGQAVPAGTVGEPYSTTFAASGGSPPYAWSVTSGAVPPGVSLAPAGVLSGTPTRPGTWTATVRVVDAAGAAASTTVSVAIAKTTTFRVHSVNGTATIWATAPQVARFGVVSGDTSGGDVVSLTFSGTRAMLIGHLGSAFPVDTLVTGQTTGSALTFLARAAGTGTASLIEVNPSTGAVGRTLASASVSLPAGARRSITNLSALTGTVRAGWTAGVELSISTSASARNEVRFGRTGSGTSGEQTLRLSILPTAAANQAPVAKAGPDRSVTRGTALSFSGATSFDPDGTVGSWAWDFGDGTTGTGATRSKTFSRAGTYTVTLTVTDDSGATAADTAVVTVR